MEANLDEVYYEKYQQYKQKYIELKQLKNNNLDGGFWFRYFNSQKSTDNNVNSSNNVNPNENGRYLVFSIDNTIDLDDIANEVKFNEYKEYVQTNYSNDANKVDVTFNSKAYFNLKYDNKAYIIDKNLNEITCNMITKDVEPNFYSKLESIKEIFSINKPENDPTINNITDNCFKNYDELISSNFNKIQTDMTFSPIKNKLQLAQTEFKTTLETERKNFIKNYEDFKEKIASTIDFSKYLKYKTITYQTNYNFIKDNSEKFLTELINKIKSETNEEIPDLNMIIKINDNDQDYKYAEFIGGDSISNTILYTKIVSAQANKRLKNKLATTTTTPVIAAATATPAAEVVPEPK